MILAALPPLQGTPARAETLAEALACAYRDNPTLQAQRAQQQVLDETYVQARSGWDPSVSVSGSGSWSRDDLGKNLGQQLVSNDIGGYSTVPAGGHYELNYGSGQVNITQPLYTGGRVAYSVRASEASIEAGRQTLRGVEAQVLLSVITDYEDVLRDQKILLVRQNNLGILGDQLTAVRNRLQVGRVTRIDVAQAETQLAQAKSLLAVAEAQLQSSRASYAAAVGHYPGRLEPPPPLPGLPATLEAALDQAQGADPDLLAAEATEKASSARVGQARAAYRPTVSLQSSYGYDGVLSPFSPKNYERTITGQVVVTQPIFAGGALASGVRQARSQNASDRDNVEAARRTTIQRVVQAWSARIGDQASLAADEQQTQNAQFAFEGVREKYAAGLETTIDLLLQQQTLESAQVALEQARHDLYLASANLLDVVGTLQGSALVGDLVVYDPVRKFQRVKNRGAVPWDPQVGTLDSLGLPHPAQEAAKLP